MSITAPSTAAITIRVVSREQRVNELKVGQPFVINNLTAQHHQTVTYQAQDNSIIHILLNQSPDAVYGTDLSCFIVGKVCTTKIASHKLGKTTIKLEKGATYSLRLVGEAGWVSVLLTNQFVNKLYIGQPYIWEPTSDGELLVLQANTAFSNVLVQVF